MNFQVELTSVCDLTCGYCPNRSMERERSFMSDEVWDAVLNKYVVPYMHENSFCPPTFIGHKDGEPLLNKQLPRRLASLPPDIKIDVYSHGLMLPRLAAQGRDFFDFCALLPNRVRYMMSYHPVNHDDSVNDYAPVVEYLKRVLLAPPSNVEFISVSHKSKWVSEEVQDAWVDTWRGLPITVHKNCSINPWTGRMEDIATCAYNGCPYADFGHWFFGVSGNIIACCLDLEEEIVLGNVLTDDPEAMFQRTTAFYAEQRRLLATKELHPRGVCRNCFGQCRDKELIQL
jgi:sulfatase maturation enzyme AslB (radical SAM superfamily)